MTNLPEPSDGEKARGIYAANMIIYDQFNL